MSVYDDQRKGGDTKLVPSNDDLRHITGINTEQEGAMDREGTSGAAQDILSREREAAKGNVRSQTGPAPANPNITRGGLGVKKTPENSTSNIQRGGFGGSSRTALKNKEDNAGFYTSRPSADGDPGLATRIKGKLTKRKTIAGLLIALVGGGGGLAGLTILTGPFQIIHAGQLLTGFHLEEKNDQSDARMLLIARYMKFLAAGTPERSRLGIMGNRYADKVQAKFKNSGFETRFNPRTGYSDLIVIDPDKAGNGADPRLRGKSAQQIVEFYDKNGIKSTVVNGKVEIDPNQRGYGYRQNQFVYRTAAKVAGYRSITGTIGARFAGKRSGISWHPIAKLDRKIIQTADAKLTKWQDKRKEYIRRTAAAASASGRTRDGSNPARAGEASQVDELSRQAAEARNNPGKLEAFGNNLKVKIGAGILGAIGVACIALLIHDTIDEVDQKNINLPSMKMGMEVVNTAAQITASSSDDLDGNTDLLGFLSDLMQDDVARNNFFDAMSINAQQGKGLVGTDLPPESKVTTRNDPLSQIISALEPFGVRQACEVVGSAAGIIILTGLGLILAPVGSIVAAVGAFILLPLAIDYIVAKMTGTEIDPLAKGAKFGGIADQGVHLFAIEQAIGNGSLPLTEAESRAVGQITDDTRREEFASKGLSDRLFDPYDHRSFISRVIDTQSPDPAANMTRFADGFLNIGRSFGSMFGKAIMAPAGAAPITPYDYGFSNFGFTVAEMDDPLYRNPFVNADRASTTLDGPGGADFVTRAKTCFGVTLEKRATTDAINNESTDPRWSISPPVEGSSPTHKKIKDPANNCLDKGTAWTSVRFFIFDTQVMNAAACYEGNEQACIDIGQESAPDTGSIAPVGAGGPSTCTTGTAGGSMPPALYATYRATDCDDFEGTAISPKWGLYDGPGHAGKGRRSPAQASVSDGLLNITGTTAGATAGMARQGGQKYGLWEARMKAPAGCGCYHPVLILWPDAEDFPVGGEVDYAEIFAPDRKKVNFFLHYSASNQQTHGGKDIDATQWHNYAIEWTPTYIRGYIDGQQFFEDTNLSHLPPRAMHQTIQLDWFPGSGGSQESTMQVDWWHQFTKI